MPRENAVALASAIDDVLDDPAASMGMAERARAYVVPRFGLERMLDRMEAVFRRAIADIPGGHQPAPVARDA